MNVPLMRNSFYKDEEVKRALADFILRTDRFSMGSECAEFETSFAKWQQRDKALFVANGSVANLLLIQALLNCGRLHRGDAVGFSAVTWPTNVMPLIQLGLVPVPIDVALHSLNISPSTLVEAHNSRPIKALFITNALGFADDLEKIAGWCSERQILLIEDNCESMGSVIKGKKLGNFGLASTFSTFIGHHLSTIEGGFVCTDDEELYEHLAIARAHGWDRNLEPKRQQLLRAEHQVDDFYSVYTFYELAYNGRAGEIQGFIGNQSLPFLDEMIQKRHDNFQAFCEYLGTEKVYPIHSKHMDIVSNFAMPLIFKDCSQYEEARVAFVEAGVEIRPIIGGNMTRQPFYYKHLSNEKDLPNANHIHEYGFYFGNRPDLTKAEINILINLLKTNT
jgi:CDP-6-deoxy-D-xylo-4-hexulose-3-dehydrase